MAVYVDDVAIPYRGMKMCHMWADTEAELQAMARAIGCRPEWHQTKRWSHYDIPLFRKKRALARGAILTDRFEPRAHVARLEGDLAMLERIAQARARDAAADTSRTAASPSQGERT